MRQRALRGGLPRDFGSILLRDAGFGVTIHKSDFGGVILFPEESIGYFWSGVGGFLYSERGVYEKLEECWK